jgi:hypothetical protein
MPGADGRHVHRDMELHDRCAGWWLDARVDDDQRDGVSIDNGVGAVAVNASRDIGSSTFPAGTYTRSATGAGGTVTKTVLATNDGC